MTKGLALAALLLASIFARQSASSAENADEGRFSDLNLEQLMDIPVSVTSTKEQTVREAPGIVTVITSDDIRASGARDLIDVLRVIPGMNFGAEVQGTVGMSFRGIWALEGKILVRLDGVDWNELAYSNFAVADRLPVSMIDRIEVIRGPGSVRYGGWAELAVIDIHTKGHENYNGARMSLSHGTLASGNNGRGTYSAAVAKSIGENSGVSIWTYGGRTLLSDRTYVALDGSVSDLADSSLSEPQIVDFAANWKTLKLRFVQENFHQNQNVHLGKVTDLKTQEAFKSLNASLSYEHAFNETYKLTPSFEYTSQLPWNSVNPNAVASGTYYDRKFTQSRGTLALSRDSGSGSAQLFGVSFATATGSVLSGNAGLFFPNNTTSNDMSQSSTSIFGEWVENTGIGNFSIGLRSEINPDYPSSTVPRFAYTRIFGDWHVKALASWAYRAPSFENVSSSPNAVRPEKTQTMEVELGQKISATQAASVTLFDTLISDPLIYTTVDVGGTPTERYENLGRTGARGVEAEWRLKSEEFSHTLATSYVSSRGISNIDKYGSGDEDRLLGIPSVTAKLLSSWFFAKDWTLAPTVVFQTARRAWVLRSDGTPGIEEVEPSTFASLALRKNNLFMKRLHLVGGVANLLNQQMPILVNYRSDGSSFASYPGRSRELFARLEYGIDF